MSENKSFKDRRKYQRVLVEPSEKQLLVDVVGFGETSMFDMSYNGAAFAQPKNKKIEDPTQPLILHLKTEIDEAKINATVIRLGDDVVAVNFANINVAARVIIERVVTDRIVGLNMKLIDPKHYGQAADFTYWFHGPKETNLYLWWKDGQLSRAQLELDSAAVVFEDDHFLFENKEGMRGGLAPLNNQQISQKALAIIEQIEDENLPLKELKKMLSDHVSG